jgi:hypothetical protein
MADLKDILPIAGGGAIALAGVAMPNKTLKYALFGGGGIIAAYGIFKIYDKAQRFKDVEKFAATDPAVGQAQRLYDILNDFLNFNKAGDATLVASSITCYDAVLKYYNKIAGRSLEQDLTALGTTGRKQFDSALKAGSKHLQCAKASDGSVITSPKASTGAAVRFAKGTALSTAVNGVTLNKQGYTKWFGGTITTVNAGQYLGRATGLQTYAKEDNANFTQIEFRPQGDTPLLFWVETSKLRVRSTSDKVMSSRLYDTIKENM